MKITVKTGKQINMSSEAELQRLLTDEKLRGEQHRLNFQTLKTEHNRLLDELRLLQEQYKQQQRESEIAKTTAQQLKRELLQKQTEVENLQVQSVPTHHFELVRSTMQDEIEKPYRERFALIEEEAEQHRTTCNQLRYDLAFLKTEYEHMQLEHKRILEELQLRHAAELSSLKEAKRAAEASLEAQFKSQDAEKLRTLQRENNELQQKLKLLRTDMEDVFAQKQHLSSQSDSIQRLQVKQVAEHTATLRSLELEKSSLQLQVERLQKEVRECNIVQSELTSELRLAQQKASELSSKVQEAEYQGRLELSNVRVEMMKQRGEIEKQRDSLAAELENIKSDLETTSITLEKQKKLAAEREKEVQRQLSALNEENWKKEHAAAAEKLELQAKLDEMELLRNEFENKQLAKLAYVEQQSQTYLREKNHLEKELEKLSITKAEGADDDDNKKFEIVRLEQEVALLTAEKQGLEEDLKELKEFNAHLQQEQDEQKTARTTIDQEWVALRTHQLNWDEQRSRLTNRISNLENQISSAHASQATERETLKKKAKKYRNCAVRLRDRVHLLRAKVEELETETELLRKNVPYEIHRDMKKQLRMLQRKHSEFRTVILDSNPSAVSLAASNVSCRSPQVCFLGDNNWATGDQDFARQEIEAVKDRIGVLDEKQRHQMMELEKGDTS